MKRRGCIPVPYLSTGCTTRLAGLEALVSSKKVTTRLLPSASPSARCSRPARILFSATWKTTLRKAAKEYQRPGFSTILM